MTTDDLILQTLHNSTLAEELRDAEIEALARIITVREYKAGETIVQQGGDSNQNELRDTLLILGSGEVEAVATTGGEKATLHLLKQGDLAGIIGFVGGNVAQVSANVVAKADSKLLLLDRARFEALLNSQPAIVYYVMRGIVRHVHGIVRRMNMQSVEMANYLYRIQGRY
ncbi:MAG TPA: cyclic nucleotide-binding domain-containing protein [Gallionellaceae bacterium]